jgi:predicted anti-sigma-YlaC factor YlaD
MTHLSPDQIVDVAEGCAGGAVKAHAEECQACRAKVESLLDAVRLAESDPQPEPSPLFWPQLAARVNEAVRREQAPAASWRPWVRWLAPAGAAAVLLLAVGVAARFSTGTPVAPAVVQDGPAAASMQAPGEPAAGADPDDDPSWLLVIGLSAELSVDDVEASGTLPLPGGTDRALAHLDDAERAELARLLREEITARTPPALQGPGA